LVFPALVQLALRILQRIRLITIAESQ